MTSLMPMLCVQVLDLPRTLEYLETQVREAAHFGKPAVAAAAPCQAAKSAVQSFRMRGDAGGCSMHTTL
jgi:hypothetical protein